MPSGRWSPASGSSSRASGRRAATSPRSSPTARRRPRRQDRVSAEDCSSTCPEASATRRLAIRPTGVHGMPANVSPQPPASGLPDSLCYPNPRRTGHTALTQPGVPRIARPAGATTIMPTPGPLELVIILVIALLILGPGKLPDVGAALGKSIKEFRKASSDVQEAVTLNVDTSPLPATPAPAPQPNPAAPAAPAAAVAAAVADSPPAAPAAVPAEQAQAVTAPASTTPGATADTTSVTS